MMRSVNIIALILLLFINSKSVAQSNQNSIDFKDVLFNDALKLSSNSGKLIFIDCYTSWCLPCKKMDKEVFVIDSVYNFYNEHFVNLKYDMEKGEGISLKEKYEVNVFPTYLFLNAKGEVVHRTTSLMPVKQFLEEAQKALSPSNSYSELVRKYKSGDRSDSLLFNYSMALKNVNRTQSEIISDELIEKITDEALHSEFGWEVIKNLSHSETDRPGKYLISNKNYFEQVAGVKPVKAMINRLENGTMYQIIRSKDSLAFFKKLDEFKKDTSNRKPMEFLLLEVEYYLETNKVDSLISILKNAQNGLLKNDHYNLNFIAFKLMYSSKGDQRILNQALSMAREAVRLNPDAIYSQISLASICLELKLKQEGILAAKKAKSLAPAITSKTEKNVQELLEKLESLD